MTRITAKSRKEIRKLPSTSSANEVRYCSWARMRAWMRRPQSASASSVSATLHHQTPHAERENTLRHDEQGDRPGELHAERYEDLRPRHGTDEDVDGELEHRRERRRTGDRRKPVGEERDGDHEPREEGHRDPRQRSDAAAT